MNRRSFVSRVTMAPVAGTLFTQLSLNSRIASVTAVLARVRPMADRANILADRGELHASLDIWQKIGEIMEANLTVAMDVLKEMHGE